MADAVHFLDETARTASRLIKQIGLCRRELQTPVFEPVLQVLRAIRHDPVGVFRIDSPSLDEQLSLQTELREALLAASAAAMLEEKEVSDGR